MADQDNKSRSASSQLTATSHEIAPEASSSSHEHHHLSSKYTRPQRPGEAIMNSDDPSTQALREWAAEKQKQYPGQNGSFAVNSANYATGLAWGGPWVLPHKGDTLPPPDERLRHGEAMYLGPAEPKEGKAGGEVKVEDEGGKKKHRLSGLFHRKGKGEKDDKGDEHDVVR